MKGKLKNSGPLGYSRTKFLILLSLAAVFSGAFILSVSSFSVIKYDSAKDGLAAANETEIFVPIHLLTPEPVRAAYLTSWAAGARDEAGKFYWRDEIVELIEETELNAVVIDIKDDTGRISYQVDDPFLQTIGSSEERIPEIKKYIDYFHDRGIYVIGRVSVFQDPYLVSRRPDLAVRRLGDGGVWRDRKGLTWLDPGAGEVWEYIVAISRDAYSHGFDEINFDYIRFPSDGNVDDIVYQHYNPSLLSRTEQLEEFFKYLQEKLAGTGIVTSADIFGVILISYHDNGIGQMLESAVPYFDYIAPMVYPSHYAPGSLGYANPNEFPYEIVKGSLDEASKRLIEASSSPAKLRPWLQDFDYGAIYDETKVRAQKQAVYDAGLTSFMLWDPGVKYTREALDK